MLTQLRTYNRLLREWRVKERASSPSACSVTDDLSIPSCTLYAGLKKKVTLELAIYYFDFKWGDEDEIDRVWLGPFNYSAFRLCIMSFYCAVGAT